MTASNALQKLVYDRLIADAGVAAAVGQRVFDNVPAGAVFPYITFGPSDVFATDAACIVGRTETLQLDCWSRLAGKLQEVKTIADAVKTALHGFDGVMAENALVAMRVTSIRYFRDPDNITAHGVVIVEAMVEEA